MYGVGNKVIEIWAIFDPKSTAKFEVPDTFYNEQPSEGLLLPTSDRQLFKVESNVSDKFAHISITFLPTPILFWYIRAIWGLNRPNITKKYRGW